MKHVLKGNSMILNKDFVKNRRFQSNQKIVLHHIIILKPMRDASYVNWPRPVAILKKVRLVINVLMDYSMTLLNKSVLHVTVKLDS